MAVKLSIIIPTYRRSEILLECLRRIERQTVVSELEVIVVSDGHDDKTSALFGGGSHAQERRSWKMPLRFIEIEKSHQGVARNEGVKHARGDYVLFIGDDAFLEPDACGVHLKMHRILADSNWQLASLAREPRAASQQTVLGFTTWDPDVGITPVMRWLEKSGWQFGYPSIARHAGKEIPSTIQHRYSYTIHLSLPLSLAKKYPFRTDVHLYGWEDIEWGMRLRDGGVRLFYEPRARVLHHHHLTLEDSLQRINTLGRAAVEMQKIVPGFDRVPSGMKLFLYKIAALLPTMTGKHRRAFLEGILAIR